MNEITAMGEFLSPHFDDAATLIDLLFALSRGIVCHEHANP
jgi:hypothetical protein